METLKWIENFEISANIKDQLHYFKNAFKASITACSNRKKKIVENEKVIKEIEEKHKLEETQYKL